MFLEWRWGWRTVRRLAVPHDAMGGGREGERERARGRGKETKRGVCLMNHSGHVYRRQKNIVDPIQIYIRSQVFGIYTATD